MMRHAARVPRTSIHGCNQRQILGVCAIERKREIVKRKTHRQLLKIQADIVKPGRDVIVRVFMYMLS